MSSHWFWIILTKVIIIETSWKFVFSGLQQVLIVGSWKKVETNGASSVLRSSWPPLDTPHRQSTVIQLLLGVAVESRHASSSFQDLPYVPCVSCPGSDPIAHDMPSGPGTMCSDGTCGDPVAACVGGREHGVRLPPGRHLPVAHTAPACLATTACVTSPIRSTTYAMDIYRYDACKGPSIWSKMILSWWLEAMPSG